MRINKVDIKGFGKLNNLSLDFTKGFNIVYGENEAGKSTMQWFLRGMFFGLKGGKAGNDGYLTPIRRFKPWIADEYKGALEYSLENNKKFRVERNFKTDEVSIFDSNFNDLSKKFESSKEKGLMFAEVHLGISEAIFEKTVLVKQRETRFDSKGSQELLTRLTNAKQTGFEDLSFNNAKEALKEAIKTSVGTGKTSTRPLDIVRVKLEELEGIKAELLKKKESFFETELNLNKIQEENNKAEIKKVLIKEASQAVLYIKEIEEMEGHINDVTKIRENILALENDAKQNDVSLKKINETKIRLESFNSYADEDIDKMNLDFENRNRLTEENERLKIDKKAREEELSDLESQIEGQKIFDDRNGDVIEKIRAISKELATLKEKSVIRQSDLEDKKRLRPKIISRVIMASSVFILAVSIIMVLFALINGSNSIIARINLAGGIVLFLAGAIMLIIYFVKLKDFPIQGTDENTDKIEKSILEQIERRQTEIDSIFKAAGVKDIEDFIIMKSTYNNNLENINKLKDKIEEIKAKIKNNLKTITELDSGIYEKLSDTKIIIDKNENITAEHINNFKESVRLLKEIEPKVKYSVKRDADLKKDIQNIYETIEKKYGNNFEKPEDLTFIISEFQSQLELNKEIVSNQISKIIEMQKASGVIYQNFSNNDLEKIRAKLHSIEELVASDLNKVTEVINNNNLKIKESETILKNFSDEHGHLQKAEEEISELNIEREELLDTGMSLQIALDVMNEASAEIQQNFAPILNEKMSENIRKITANRYSELRADDDLMLRVINPETGDIGSWSSLSGGAIDQIYFALRIAMADMIALPGEILPLIMDEVMAQYDDKRTENTIGFMMDMAKERQIILLTCKSREVDIARELCGDKVNIINLTA
jgi:DNA repair exonuclease SbcCD ATPase subunit